MRKIAFVGNEFYHVYNRGVDRRSVFSNGYDLQRFFQSMQEFNTTEPIGSIFQNSFNNHKKEGRGSPLVQFVAYCLNPNHFHFILTQVENRGIEKFMHKLGTGYTGYFNEKQERSGSLFQGTFKANHINSNEYLLHAAVYVNLNYKVHKLKEGKDLYLSSWEEYINPEIPSICTKNIILGQFKNIERFAEFAESTLASIIDRRDLFSELENEKMKQDNDLEAKPPSKYYEG